MREGSIDYERSSDGSLTYVRISGVVDEDFSGRQAAKRVKSERAVLNCAGIKLITSFGIRRWLEFLQELDGRKIDVYFVECSPKFVDELNQVVSFTGKGRVLSAYAPYVCPDCEASRSVLLRVDNDAHVIRNMQPPAFTCLACGGAMEFEDDPSSYFTGLASHTGAQIDENVLNFLEARLGYEAETERQLHLRKVLVGDTTVLWFGGTLDGTVQGRKLAEGLEGQVVLDLSEIIHVQKQGIGAFRDLIEAAAGRAQQLLVVGCPALVIERALEGIDPNTSNLEVVSARIPFHCRQCDATEFVRIELAGRDGREIRQGRLPGHRCNGCGSDTRPMVGASLLDQLMRLREPTVPRGLSKTLRQAQKQVQAAKGTKASKKATRRISPWAAAAAAAALVLGASLAVSGATFFWRSKEESAGGGGNKDNSGGNQGKKFERPDWIVSDVPSSSYCIELGLNLSCTGVSSYRISREAAEKEAFDSALEALVYKAMLNVEDKPVVSQRDVYTPARTKALQALEQARYEQSSDEPKVLGDIRAKRTAVADMLRAQSPPGTPTQRSDWYWEEYESQSGKGTEFLVWVRVDINKSDLDALAKYYGKTQKGGGAKVLPAIPELAWVVDLSKKTAFFVQEAGGGAVRSAGGKKSDLIVAGAGTKASDVDSLFGGGHSVSLRRGDRYEDVVHQGGGATDKKPEDSVD